MELDGISSNVLKLGEAAQEAVAYITSHVRSHSTSFSVCIEQVDITDEDPFYYSGVFYILFRSLALISILLQLISCACSFLIAPPYACSLGYHTRVNISMCMLWIHYILEIPKPQGLCRECDSVLAAWLK
jgi:hypothetical protein